MIKLSLERINAKSPYEVREAGGGYEFHTKAELNAMLDEAEARFEAGLGIPHEEVMREINDEEQAANVK